MDDLMARTMVENLSIAHTAGTTQHRELPLPCAVKRRPQGNHIDRHTKIRI